MISGGNAEGLKAEPTPAGAPASVEAVIADMYPTSAEGQAASGKVEADKAASDKATADKVEADKVAADKAEADKKAAEQTPEQKAEAEKAAKDKADADKVASDKAAADKAVADKAEADKVAAMTPEQKAAYEKEKADKVEADKKAADEAAKKKEPVDLSKMALPDGVKVDPAILSDLTKIANEHGLDVKAAEALIPVGQKVAQNTVAQINKGYETIRAGWRDQVAADPTIGTKEQMAIADKGLTAYGSPALRQVLDESGLGDHPEVIRMFHKIGKTVSEDVIERGGSGDKKVTDAAEIMYPSMKRSS